MIDKKEIPYDIVMFDRILAYLAYQKTSGFRSKLSEFTETGYPKLFCMGWTSHTNRMIVILKKGNWKYRLIHEIGHMLHHEHGKPFVHVSDKNNIMYPYFNRGTEGEMEIIEALAECYNYNQGKKVLKRLFE